MPQPKAALKIPKKEIVKFVVKESLQKRKALSQKELVGLISNGLKKGDRKYSITGKRARLIALDAGIMILTETRRGPMPKKCPVCGHFLKKRHSRNLFGKKIVSGLSCRKCSYHAEEGKWMPKRYRFEMP